MAKSGGAEKFLHFMEQELEPKVNNTFEADPARHLFFGHSLVGLFGLHALFTKQEAFHSYMISSPSIWWNQQCILELESECIDRLRDGNLKIYFSAGAQEKRFMVEDVKELAERLTRLEDSRLDIMLDIAEGENHISVVPAALSRALICAEPIMTQRP
ncbi:alpha/beta hydrolase-fold protein [Cytobacillus sp. NJ13]|nr:alpha/beta hydrolase-fold protein [Cytobacillus sp. NJ13]